MPQQLTRGYSPSAYQPAQYTVPERVPHQAPSPRAGGQVSPKLAELLSRQQTPRQQQQERPKGVLDTALESLGSGFGQAAGAGLSGQVAKHVKRSIFEKTLNQINPNMSSIDKLKAIAHADPELQPVLEKYFEAEEKKQEAQALAAALGYGGGQPGAPGGVEGAGGGIPAGVNPKNVLDVAKFQQKERENALKAANPKKGPQSALDKEKAKIIASAIQNIPHIEQSKANIARIKELKKDLSGYMGIKRLGKAAFGSEDAAEMNALGLATIEPVIKIFNPVGAIPTQKINLIKAQYAVNATDTQRTIDGKINALEKILSIGEKRSKQLLALTEKYGEDIPTDEFLKFEQGNADAVEKIIKSNLSNLGSVPAGHTRMYNAETNDARDVLNSDVAAAKAGGYR